MKPILTFDIGVASVGWAVIDSETKKIIESCSAIFSEANPSQNKDRRQNRGAKRMSRRKTNRINDFRKLWTAYSFSVPEINPTDIVDLKVKGLSEEITMDELFAVLKNYLKHRGISYLDEAELKADESGEKQKSKGNAYARGLQINEEALRTKYPCEIQQDRMKQYGQYRGQIHIEDSDTSEWLDLSNVFTVSAYKKEIRQILDTQKNMHPEITEEFCKEYLKIFERKRKYYVGPGNEKSRTDYGIYTTKMDEQGSYITEQNIFEKLIGNCSIYPEERRTAAASYTAQEFNILNDLNNLKVNEEKLTESEKREVISRIKAQATKSCSASAVKKIIAKIIGEKEKDIQWRGLRTDKNKTKEEFHTFECYRKMRLAMEENGLPPIEELSKDTLDKIGEILTLNTERDAIEERLRADELNLNLSEEMIQFLIEFRKGNADLFTKWHSFSLKLMNELIPEMYEQPKEQMTLLTEHNLLKVKQQDFKGKNYIPVDMVSDKIFNPVVAKSVRISFRIFNELLKKYKHFDQIVLELPRDKNSDEEKKRIISSQDKNEKEWKEIEKILEERKILIPHRIYTNSKNLKLKLRLWKEQEGKCLYSGKMIDLEELIYEGHLFEIDHIIPFSVLPDDSRTNKVLVYATENQKKKNRTPYDYLMHTNEHQSFEEYKANVLYLYKNNKISKKKMENLLFMENLNKAEVMKEFINRNINDTGYAARVVLNTIQGFMKAREEDTKVKVIRGSFTHQMRVNLGLPKDRDESNAHHAVDAMLMGYAQMGYAEYNRKQSTMIDLETGEILDPTMEISEKEYEKLLYLAEKHQEILREIKCAEQKIRYWHEIDRKCNRGLCNQTIRGTRKLNDDPEDQTVVKINKLDIRTDDWKTFKKFAGSEKDREKLLVYRHDEKTYEELVRIMHDYADGNNNPFVKFEEEHGPIRKYAKNHNGPKIGKLKYIAGKVSSCIDISHKYGHPKGSKKVILESLEPYRMDVYYNKEKGQYYLVGIKQSDIKCESGKYVIDEEAYAARLRKDKMITGTESRADLESKGYEFMYSFYRNEIIEYEKNGIIKKERFWSKIDYFKNKIEVKPLEKNSYYEEDGKGDIIRDKNGKPKTKQQFVTLTKATCIRKYNKDILGKEYVCSKEKFSSECW